MALPVINTPTYDLKLSSGETIKYRPFLVKEQKILLLSVEDGSTNAIINGVSQIINNCTFGKVDVNKIPLFDVEHIFLRLREKSVGEVADFRVKCIDDACNGLTNISVDLASIVPDESKYGKRQIKVTNNVTVNMRYPTLNTLNSVKDLNNVEDNFKFLSSCIESIEYDGQIYDTATTSREELQEFIENLTSEQFQKIKDFFTDMPRMTKRLDYTCGTCGKSCTRELSGLQNFLA